MQSDRYRFEVIKERSWASFSLVINCHTKRMNFDRMSTDKAITCRAVQFFFPLRRSSTNNGLCDLWPSFFFFVLLTRSKWHEEVPDGGHHLAHFSLPSQIPLELSFWQFFKSYPVVTRNDQPMSGWVVAGAVGKSCVHAHTRTRTRSLGFTNGFLSFPEFFFSILVRYVEDSQVLWIWFKKEKEKRWLEYIPAHLDQWRLTAFW